MMLLCFHAIIAININNVCVASSALNVIYASISVYVLLVAQQSVREWLRRFTTTTQR